MDRQAAILFNLTDMQPGDDWEWSWWECVWAHNEQQAIEWGWDNYQGDWPAAKRLIKTHGSFTHLAEYAPPGPFPRAERRKRVLRLAGWQQEGESCCECCDLYPLGMKEYGVCATCCLCKSCRQTSCEPCKDCEDEDVS